MALLPKVKLKAVVSFPATILDGVGVDVVKANGIYQFNIAFDDFAPPVAGLTDPTNQTVLVWNSVTNAYVLVPASGFVGSIVSPATVVPLIESGTGLVGTSVKYAREDHIHPAAAGSGNVVGPASAVDSNLAAFNTTTGKLIKDSGVPLAAASGAVRYDAAQGLSGSQQTQARANIGTVSPVGVTDGSNATAGNVGELVEASVALSAVSLTTLTPANITSISLSAGDWDVYGTGYYTTTATTTITLVQTSTNITSVTIDASPGHFGEFNTNGATLGAGVFSVSPGQPKRYNLTTSTTVFLTTNQSFAASTLSAGGKIRARRIR